MKFFHASNNFFNKLDFKFMKNESHLGLGTYFSTKPLKQFGEFIYCTNINFNYDDYIHYNETFENTKVTIEDLSSFFKKLNNKFPEKFQDFMIDFDMSFHFFDYNIFFAERYYKVIAPVLLSDLEKSFEACEILPIFCETTGINGFYEKFSQEDVWISVLNPKICNLELSKEHMNFKKIEIEMNIRSLIYLFDFSKMIDNSKIYFQKINLYFDKNGNKKIKIIPLLFKNSTISNISFYLKSVFGNLNIRYSKNKNYDSIILYKTDFDNIKNLISEKVKTKKFKII